MMLSEKIRVSLRNEITNFHLCADLNSIEQKLNSYIKRLIPKINSQDLNNWRVLILIVIRNTDAIGIFKRSRRYPSDHTYEMSISIPIPDEQQASYGSHKASIGFFNALNDKFYILEPNFKDYDRLD
ncbi:unnamed protein product [Commensalibacter communis]|uniref:Uncharacterized protein n=1 Tax=Commensalibacter communis TaxID=2972786 RepID=A0A9W4TLH7_9PROT|nr:Imm9 family immunity protein [Commensalibacter communis]CAI3927612.1 unnamed protein product [Commensalibacter communis]CAI3928174.1 unnamed protein product [Commensalibacter communis]CAI3933275.1 unnamed protein product [Commensalibacter communis]CAI3934810.1 unnamed protein product [Commensalibacter communis]CAI3940287.1 unnamed protein product [Commensalibacter communis]